VVSWPELLETVENWCEVGMNLCKGFAMSSCRSAGQGQDAGAHMIGNAKKTSTNISVHSGERCHTGRGQSLWLRRGVAGVERSGGEARHVFSFFKHFFRVFVYPFPRIPKSPFFNIFFRIPKYHFLPFFPNPEISFALSRHKMHWRLHFSLFFP